MIYIIAIASIICGYFFIKDIQTLLALYFSIVIITIFVAEMSIGRFIEYKIKRLIDYMEGHISCEETFDIKEDEEEEDK